MSGSLGCWPIAPAAKPAKPAPSSSSPSRCRAGTSLALGLPCMSTNCAKMNSTSFSRMWRWTSSRELGAVNGSLMGAKYPLRRTRPMWGGDMFAVLAGVAAPQCGERTHAPDELCSLPHTPRCVPCLHSDVHVRHSGPLLEVDAGERQPRSPPRRHALAARRPWSRQRRRGHLSRARAGGRLQGDAAHAHARVRLGGRARRAGRGLWRGRRRGTREPLRDRGRNRRVSRREPGSGSAIPSCA